MKTTSYGYDTLLRDESVADARTRVIAALATEGFGVLTEINIAATLEEKLGVKLPPQLILGACNPALAHQALQAEPRIGLILPCNVVIRQTDDGVSVSIANPTAIFGLVDNAGLGPMVEDGDSRLRRVLAALDGAPAA